MSIDYYKQDQAPTSVGRIQVTDGCPSQPGHCAVCGTTSGKMIDFGLDLDFYGVVYLCLSSCLREAANLLGYYSPAQVEHITDQFESFVEIYKDTVKHNEELTSAVDSLTSLRFDFSGGTVDPNQLTLDLGSPETEQESDRADEETGGEEHGSVKQDDVGGSSDLHYDDSLDKFGL